MVIPNTKGEMEKQMGYYEFIGEDKERKSERAEKYWEISQLGKKVTVRFVNSSLKISKLRKRPKLIWQN